MVKGTCGLHVDRADGGVCYSLGELRDIAKAYNSSHTDKIRLGGSKGELISSIRAKFRKVCGDDQECWSRSLNLPINAFRVKVTRHERLCSKTIDDTMDQVEKKYRNFTFLNAVPSDIYRPQIFREFVKPVRRLRPMTAVIFNTLPAGTAGEHWVLLFIDNVDGTVEYFDPLAELPNKNIKRSISHIRKTYDLSSYEFFINTRQHQASDDDIDCGVYCMTYIMERLEGKNFYDISDTLLEADRTRFFSVIN